MASKNSRQMITGKSFEYALLIQFEEKLKDKTNVNIIKNSAFIIAKDCFDTVTGTERSEYLLSASFAVNFLMDIEPRLSNNIDKKDILQLEILTDDKGKSGDVRDVLAIRALQKWEIGVSAKNNHKAVKHPRLSQNIDFGEKWIGVKVSEEYFSAVRPIFQHLKKLREESNKEKLWKDIGDYHTSVYVPVLNAFVNELKMLDKNNPKIAARNFVQYLVGNKDFYKVIKSKNSIEIHAYNLNGTLNLDFEDIVPKYIVPKLVLPTKFLNIDFEENSKNTVIVTLDNDWTLSFRIHNASSRVEPSLKFDINLLKSPKNLFKNTLSIIHE
ncbi:type II restriction endonuclease [uncultured Candidatus Thioglobus sp.]|nr:type II restriction endonuclease [uncultured Candidatus Thioglobus sp.]